MFNITHFKGICQIKKIAIWWVEQLILLFLAKIRVMRFQQDQIKHFGVCLAVAFSASTIEAICGATYIQSLVTGIIAGGAIGVGKEYGDKCAPGNKWDWNDIAADMSGALIGSALGSLLSLLNH